jgi:hypothetical protein
VCHPSDRKKPLVFIVLWETRSAPAPTLGKLEQLLRIYAAQRYVPDLRSAASEFDGGLVEFVVGVLTPGFDDLPDEIARNE